MIFFRQSLAPSRLMGAKRSVAEPVKTSAVGSSKSHIPENKVGVKPGKSKPTDAKKSATIEITSKERNIGRMKPVDKIELKSPTVKVSSVWHYYHSYWYQWWRCLKSNLVLFRLKSCWFSNSSLITGCYTLR